MPLEPAIQEVEALKDAPALAAVLAANRDAIQGVKWDRSELTIYIERSAIRAVCATLRAAEFNFLSDITCADGFPVDPRFGVAYHLLSHNRKERVRLKVMLNGADPTVESIYPLWPAADFFERELFDLFGITFLGHPNLIRIMMPEDWEGHPLRRDYPVEGYR